METRDRSRTEGNGHGDGRHTTESAAETSPAVPPRGPGGYFERALERLKRLAGRPRREEPVRRREPQMIQMGARERYAPPGEQGYSRTQHPLGAAIDEREWREPGYPRHDVMPGGEYREPEQERVGRFGGGRGWHRDGSEGYSATEGYYEPEWPRERHPWDASLREEYGPTFDRERQYERDQGWGEGRAAREDRSRWRHREDEAFHVGPHDSDLWRDEYRAGPARPFHAPRIESPPYGANLEYRGRREEPWTPSESDRGYPPRGEGREPGGRRRGGRR